MNKWGELGRNWKNIIKAWFYHGIFQKKGDPTEWNLSESVTLQIRHKCSQKMTNVRKRCINKLLCLEQCKLILACRKKIFSVFQETCLLGIESWNTSEWELLVQGSGRGKAEHIWPQHLGQFSIRRFTREHGNSIEVLVKTRFHFQLGKWHTNCKGLRKIKNSRMMERLNFKGEKKNP